MTPTAHASTIPPPLAERLLRASVRDAEWRDAVSGDLREEFASLVARRGPPPRTRWYWRQALPLAARFAAGRVVPAMTPPRRRRHRGGRHRTHVVARRRLVARAASRLARAVAAAGADRDDRRHAGAGARRQRRRLQPGRRALPATVALRRGRSADRRRLRRQSATSRTSTASRWPPPISATGSRRSPPRPGWRRSNGGIRTCRAWTCPSRWHGFRVTPGFFETAAACEPILGRDVQRGRRPARRQPLGGAVARVLAAPLQRRSRASSARTLRLDGAPYEVIGVMPPRFVVPYGADVWAPLAYDRGALGRPQARGPDDVRAAGAGPHASTTAREEWRAVVARQAAEFPETNRNRPVTVRELHARPRRRRHRPVPGDLAGRGRCWCCSSPAPTSPTCCWPGAPSGSRSSPFVWPSAPGAAGWCCSCSSRALCLAVLGVASAPVLAALAIRPRATSCRPTSSASCPATSTSASTWPTLAMMAALGAAGHRDLLAGAGAAGLARGAARRRARRARGRRRRRPGRAWMRSLLAGAQVALTLTLVVASVLIVGAVHRAVDGVIGFDKRQLMTARADPARGALRRAGAAPSVHRRRARSPAGAAGGRRSAAAMSTLPYGTNPARRTLRARGRGRDERRAPARRPGAQRARRLPGDDAHPADAPGAALGEGDGAEAPPVALVSQVLAERYFPGEDPIGRRFRLAEDGEWITIVGVVGDVVHDWFAGRRNPTVIVPLAQDPTLRAGLRGAHARRLRGGWPTPCARPSRPPTPTSRSLTLRHDGAGGHRTRRRRRLLRQGAHRDERTGAGAGPDGDVQPDGVPGGAPHQGSRRCGWPWARRRGRSRGWPPAAPARITAGGLVVGTGDGRGPRAVHAVGALRAGLAERAGRAWPCVVLAVVTMAAGYLPARRAAGQDPWLALRTE